MRDDPTGDFTEIESLFIVHVRLASLPVYKHIDATTNLSLIMRQEIETWNDEHTNLEILPPVDVYWFKDGLFRFFVCGTRDQTIVFRVRIDRDPQTRMAEKGLSSWVNWAHPAVQYEIDKWLADHPQYDHYTIPFPVRVDTDNALDDLIRATLHPPCPHCAGTGCAACDGSGTDYSNFP